MTVTAHWAVENDEQKSFEIKNALLEEGEFPDSAHTYNIRKAVNASKYRLYIDNMKYHKSAYCCIIIF
jgi:hypothetical protein